jgi:hypothetical protein
MDSKWSRRDKYAFGKYAVLEAPQEQLPAGEAPADMNEPTGPIRTSPATGSATGSPDREPSAPKPGDSSSPVVRGSRWVDYDTHELLEMISELEDERRWARLREGVLWAFLFHIALLSAITWIPMYVLKVPKVMDPFDVLKKREELSYLNLPPDALRELQKKPKPAEKPPTIDKQTLDEMKREAPPAPAQPPPQQAPEQAKAQPPPPIPPNPQSQSPIEAPRPAAVPARPNFAMDSQNPADQLRRDMQNAMRNHGGQNYGSPGSGGLSMHPGAGTGGVDVLSDTQGVDFSSWLARWHFETERTWDPLIPDEVNPPIDKTGMVAIQFKVLPNGRLMDGSVQLVGRSGDVALDRAAWGALTGSNYPPLPKEFHGPYLELRAWFLYNIAPPQ